ncbi:MAG: TetR family transcriptional regulator [Alphaproteobacteria bacterium]|nr:TetR family transcriptional regulator [Alphaproteobacteria bacterium]
MKSSAKTAANAERKSVVSRREILDAAAGLFRMKGYYATTLRDIAAAVGMKAGSVYYHFDSKEQILEEVLDIGIRSAFEAVRKSIEALPETATWRERFRVALNAHFASLFQLGDYLSANLRVFGQAPPHIYEQHIRIRREYDDYWRNMYEKAQAAGEIRSDVNLSALRLLVFGAMNWAIEWYKPGKKTVDSLADEYTRILFDGVGPR